WDQGELTAYKDKLRMNRTLGALAEAIGMHRFLSSSPDELKHDIEEFNEAVQLLRIQERLKPEEERGPYWAEMDIAPPVAHIVTSLVGAVALDSSLDLKVLQGLYDRLFRPFYDEFCSQDKEIGGSARKFENFMNGLECNKWRYVHDSTNQTTRRSTTLRFMSTTSNGWSADLARLNASRTILRAGIC
ncbi:hypothetical protein A4X09_0g7811, partial [Tilletia walkeri]